MAWRWHGATRIGRVALAAPMLLAMLAASTASGGAAAAGLVGARTAAIAVTRGALHDHGDGAELAFTVTQPVEARAFTLTGPDRVILDLPQLAFQIDPASLGDGVAPGGRAARGRRGHRAPPPGLVASVRYGLMAPGRSRVVVALAGPARIVSTAVERDAAGAAVLTLKLAATDRLAFDAAAHPPQLAEAASPATSVVSAASPATRPAERPVVVIDPGHGGPDTGAERGGLVEKDVTLAFARSLAARLEAGGHYAVVLTRATDVFIPLSERVAIARRSGAALMVSVHADTLPETSRDAADVSGATVYTVSDRASDGDAATVAAKENAADAAAGVAGQADTADVNDILLDLTRQETRAYSHVFARTLVNYWKVVGRLNKNPQRAAGFVVLKAPDVPSVLLELGYLSSPVDAAALKTDEWREKAATRMAEAVDIYFTERRSSPSRQLSAGLAADPAGAARK